MKKKLCSIVMLIAVILMSGCSFDVFKKEFEAPPFSLVGGSLNLTVGEKKTAKLNFPDALPEYSVVVEPSENGIATTFNGSNSVEISALAEVEYTFKITVSSQGYREFSPSYKVKVSLFHQKISWFE